jgi:hypothetical protein
MNRNIASILAKGLDPLDHVYREREARINQRKNDPSKKRLAFEVLFDVVLRQQAEIQALWSIVEKVGRAADVKISYELPIFITDEEPEDEEEKDEDKEEGDGEWFDGSPIVHRVG